VLGREGGNYRWVFQIGPVLQVVAADVVPVAVAVAVPVAVPGVVGVAWMNEMRPVRRLCTCRI